MQFHLIIDLNTTTGKYTIIAVNPTNEHHCALYESKDWDAIKAEKDYLLSLFGCDFRGVKEHT